MMAGVLNGWRYGLIRSVSPLSSGEEAKDLRFADEVESIRAAASGAATAADGASEAPPTLGVASGMFSSDRGSKQEGGTTDEKELVVM